MIPTGSTPQQDGQQVAAAFLSAWRSGNLTAAAKLTDQHAAAKAYLAMNAKYLDLGKMTVTTDSVAASANSTSAAPSETAKFTVNASVAAKYGSSVIRGTWAYHSTLVAYQQANSSVWFVELEARRGRAQPHLGDPAGRRLGRPDGRRGHRRQAARTSPATATPG